MKKRILLLAFLAGFFLVSKAQNEISLTWGGNTLGDTVTIFEGPGDLGELAFHAIVHNNTDNGMNILAVRTNIDLVAKTQNYFCWANSCYPSKLDTSLNYEFIPAVGQSGDEDFVGHYFYNDSLGNHLYGTSLIKYSFFNMDHPEIINTVVVKYMLGYTGLAENGFKDATVSNIYPNPASSFATIDYRMSNTMQNGEFRIINLVGKVVKKVPIIERAGKLKIDLSGLSEGIYFYTISFDGTIYKTKKLIVKR